MNCKIWLIVSFVLWILAFVKLLGHVFAGSARAWVMGSVFDIVLGMYFMWVVYSFIQEIQRVDEEDGTNPSHSNVHDETAIHF
jgi:uncharacterized protein YqhQ